MSGGRLFASSSADLAVHSNFARRLAGTVYARRGGARIAAARFVLGCVAALAAQAAQAATYTWNGGPSGPWDTATNWSPAGVTWTGIVNTALFNTAGASVTVNSGSDTVAGITFLQNTTLSGGTINLVAGTNNLVNSATGATTLGTALNIVGPSAQSNWTGGSGTLNINAPITDSLSTVEFYEGNYTLNSPGSININGYAFVMSASAATTNFLQTGGLISVNRPNTAAVYLTQSGTASYTLTGGTMLLPGIGENMEIGDGHPAAMTINGTGALVSTPVLNLNVGAVTTGAVNLQSGLLQTDYLVQSNSGVAFNFSGGTLQPVDSGYLNGGPLNFGSATAANNVAITVSSTGATMSSNDASGVGRVVNVYANLLGNGTLNTVGAGALLLSGSAQCNIANSGNLVFNNAAAQVYGGVLSGSGNVVMASAGGLTLTSSNTYTGATTIASGSVILGQTGTLGSGNITVSPGALLDVSAYAGGYNLNSGVLTVGRTSGPNTDVNGSLNVQNAALSLIGTATLSGGLALNGGTLDYGANNLAQLGSALTLSGSNEVALTTALSSGTYTLISGGSVPSLGTVQSDLYLGGLASTRQSYTWATPGGTAITLTVSGSAGNLLWNSANSTWNTNNTSSWYNTATLAADKFQTGDFATFNDMPGGGAAAVNIGGTVTPASITVSNTAVAYTFSGTGSIGGPASLVMNGPGALTINNNNSYSGGTVINGGLLNLGNSGALGSGVLTIAGGTLDNTSGAAMTIGGNLAQNWNGNFTFVGSKPLNLGSGLVTLGTTPTVTVNSSTLTVGGNISGSNGLTLAGTGTLILAGPNTYTGNTTISQGVLQLGTGGAIPTGAAIAGNLVFSNAANTAVFDLNGNNSMINGLSQPGTSTTNLVVNNLPGSTATLSVGNGNVSSTFAGVLANNTGAGGVLALTKVGGGMLTLMGNSNTYTGPTTLNSGTLQLGTGIAGQDGSLGNSSAILTSNAGVTLAINNLGPTILPAPISGPTSTGLTLALNGTNTVTLTGLNALGTLQMNNNGTLTGGTISLLESNPDLVVNATGTTTLATPVVMNAPAAQINWSGNSSGTLAITAPMTVNTVSNLFINSGNYSMNAGGSLIYTVSGAVVMNDVAGSTTNFLQSGGTISLNRPANNTLYLTQAGTTNYMITGGMLMVNTGTTVLAQGTSGRIGTLTINGAGALASTPAINYDGVPGAVGTLNLQNGALHADTINTSVATAADLADCVFNFSGGTLQPLDNGTLAGLSWGSATATDNTSITLSGSEVMSSNDATGTGRTVHVYSPLGGSGVLTTAGNGTLIFSGTNSSNYNGEFLLSSGTVQLGSATGLPSTSGTVQVSGGKLDLNGFSAATGAVNMASGSIVNSGAAATLTATGFTLEGGTASAVLGGATTPLTMAGPGLAVLSASNSYGGGTTINGGTLQLGGLATLGSSTSSLTLNNGVFNLNGNNVTVGGVSGPGGLVTATSPATLTLAPTAPLTYSGQIGGSASVTLNASHQSQTLAGSLSYTGVTNVTAGTLSITGGTAFTNSPRVNVTAGAVLDVSQLSGGLSLTGGTLSGGRTSSPGVDVNGNVNLNNSFATVGNGASAGTLTIGGNLSMNGATFSYYPGAEIATTGVLTLGGTDYVTPSVPLSAGTYTLFAWSGGLTGGTQDLATAGVFGSSPRQSYTFAQSGNSMTLTIAGTAANLVWTGAANNLWDNGVSANWYNTTSGSADRFFPADNVTFNDTAGTANGNVSISGGALGSIQPGTLTVSNTVVSYTFSGTGSIAGVTSLVMNGPGSLTINTSNTYTGGTFLNGGVLTAGSNGALGSAALSISGGTLNSNASETYAGGTILNGGLLNLGNSAALGGGAVTISGGSLNNTSGAAMTLGGNPSQSWNNSFTFVGSKPLNLGNGPVTLGISPTVTVSGSTLTVGGNISGGYGLTLAGQGMLGLAGSNSYSGGTTIAGGTLQLQAAGALPLGANTGNLVFTNPAAAAVLDLDGNNAIVNNLTQPSLSTTNMVINSLSGGTVTLTVGNNNATSTFGGVLANNTGTGGVLALTKTGAGTLTLMGNQTYTGATTIDGGGLQLGTGIPGQDASIAASTSIVNSGTLIVSNVGPTTLAAPITGAGNLVQNSPSTLTLSGQNTVAALALTNSGTVTGGTISLTAGTTFVNNAGGLSTLASPLNIVGAQAPNIWSSNSAGTLNIAAPITDSNDHMYFYDGNYVMGPAGSITVSGFALVMGGSNDTGVHTSNFLQTGGVISDSRPSAPASTFFVSQGGTTNYTMTGGSLLVTTGTASVAYNATGRNGYMTINGAGAVASLAGLNLFGASGGTGEVNLLNGTLQVDNLFTSAAASSTAYDIFNFSGGTLQPLDGNVSSAGFGSATTAQNVTMTLSGSGATLSSSDAGGVGRTVPVYATLIGSGTLTTAGAGTVVLQGSNSGFTGQLSVAGGTAQIGNASTNALGGTNGSVLVNGGVLDINGNNSANPGPVTLAAGAIIDSAGSGVLNAASYTVQSGTVSAVLGGGSAPLHKTTSGLVLLTAANTYGGATTINAGTLALGATGTLGNGSGNVTVSPGAVLDVSAWYAAGGYSFNNMTLTAGRTSSFATDINGSLNMSNATIAPTGSGTMTISGSLNLNGNVTYDYVLGNKIAVGGALSLSNPTYLLPAGQLASGTYTLMTYNGGSPDAADDFMMGGSYQAGTRQIYTFGTSGGTAVTLTVSGNPGNLLWNTSNGIWDVQNTPSWFNTTTGSADVFYAADNVTFNDRPGGSAAIVNINASVSPASMTVSNTAVSYTMNGGGSIDGSAALVKNGPGSLTINTYNSYTGGTFLNGGRLNLGTYLALGNGALTISGGTLDNTSGGAMSISNSQNWNASFRFVGSYPLTFSGPVTLGATPTVTLGSGALLTAQGGISGNYGLTVAGGGTLNLVAASNYTGDTTIFSGVLQMGAQNALPNGFGTGNVVFTSAATSAVLDLNGNDTAINELSQPALSSANMVVNDSGGANTLTVGNNNVSSTFGGILADNNNSGGSQLNLQKTGTGVLTLINSNTYSGSTTIANGTLQLGDGTPGHDGSVNLTNGIANNGTLAFNYHAPQTIAAAISGTGTIAQLGAAALTFAGGASADLLAISNTGSINGGPINLNSPNGSANVNTSWVSLANTATGTVTLNAPINMTNGKQDWTGNSAGTLNIAGAITQSSGHFFLDDGNYTMSGSASISLSTGAYAMVLNDVAGSTTNFTQTGGSIAINRNNGNALYLTQAGNTNYTMTGGTISLSGAVNGAGGDIVLGYGAGTGGTLTINGPTALLFTPNIALNGSVGGPGALYQVNGTVQTDSIFGSGPDSIFYFSGGTLQPQDSLVTLPDNGWGEPGDNFTITLSGTGAVMNSTDATGNPEIVNVYAGLAGSGGVHLTGAGTLILAASNLSNNTYSGGSFIDSGTVQLGNSAALGTGSVMVNGGTVDLAGFSPTFGGLSGAAGGLIANLSGTSNSTMTVSQSGTSTYAGTIDDGPTNTTALVLAGPGTLYLSGTNTYSGGTTVESGELIVTNNEALADNSSLIVGNASLFGGATPAEAGSAATSSSVAPVPESGTAALLGAAGAAALATYRKRRRQTIGQRRCFSPTERSGV
jgi:fibronectin-binding autotransporter adhesin